MSGEIPESVSVSLQWMGRIVPALSFERLFTFELSDKMDERFNLHLKGIKNIFRCRRGHEKNAMRVARLFNLDLVRFDDFVDQLTFGFVGFAGFFFVHTKIGCWSVWVLPGSF